MAQLANTQKKTLEKNILNVTTVKLFSFKKFNVLCLFEKWIATPQRFWPYCILFQILRHILSHENSFVDCMTWRRKDVSLSPLRWQFFCLVLCNNENKKKSERLQFSTQKQTSARMCWNCFHWNKRLALQHNLTHLKNLLKYGGTMVYAVCTILKSYFWKVSFSREVFVVFVIWMSIWRHTIDGAKF